MTYSSSMGGEHATTVNGNSLNPGMKDIMAVADNIKLNHQKALGIAERIQDIVQKEPGALIKRRGQ
jgi:serine/threonine-protein kinase HipA